MALVLIELPRLCCRGRGTLSSSTQARGSRAPANKGRPASTKQRMASPASLETKLSHGPPLQLQTSDLAPHTYTLLTRRRPQGGYDAERRRRRIRKGLQDLTLEWRGRGGKRGSRRCLQEGEPRPRAWPPPWSETPTRDFSRSRRTPPQPATNRTAENTSASTGCERARGKRRNNLQI